MWNPTIVFIGLAILLHYGKAQITFSMESTLGTGCGYSSCTISVTMSRGVYFYYGSVDFSNSGSFQQVELTDNDGQTSPQTFTKYEDGTAISLSFKTAFTLSVVIESFTSSTYSFLINDKLVTSAGAFGSSSLSSPVSRFGLYTGFGITQFQATSVTATKMNGNLLCRGSELWEDRDANRQPAQIFTADTTACSISDNTAGATRGFYSFEYSEDKYFIDGVPATVHGEPHFRLWNGNWHDFQGTSRADIDINHQYYYMHPCKTATFEEMPFTILGRHLIGVSGYYPLTTLDYITVELRNLGTGDIYYVWFSSDVHAYARGDDTNTTLYDKVNEHALTTLVSKTAVQMEAFKVTYTQSGDDSAYLNITTNATGPAATCNIDIYMKSEGNYNQGLGRHTMQFMQISQPKCYKPYTCGLLGSFLHASNIQSGKDKMLTCSGQFVEYREGQNVGPGMNYDSNGWGWEKEYVATNCDFWNPNIRRRLATDLVEGTKYEPAIYADVDFDVGDICDDDVNQTAIEECAAAREELEICCNIINGDVCDEFQNHCELDTCYFVGSDPSLNASEIVFDLFTSTIDFMCTIPGVETQEDPSNLIAYPGAFTWFPTPSPTVSQTVVTEVTEVTEEVDGTFVLYYSTSVVVAFIAMLMA